MTLRSLLHATYVGAIALGVAAAACSSRSAATTVPSDSAFCSAFDEDIAKCPSIGEAPACQDALVAACTSYVGSVSIAFKSAIVQCGVPQTCNEFSSFASSCIRDAVVAAPLTAAQSKLAQDFCAGCGAGSSTCVATFWGTVGDAAIGGVGSSALTSSDAVDEEIDATCLASSSETCESFYGCARAVIEAATPNPAACTASGGTVDAG